MPDFLTLIADALADTADQGPRAGAGVGAAKAARKAAGTSGPSGWGETGGRDPAIDAYQQATAKEVRPDRAWVQGGKLAIIADPQEVPEGSFRDTNGDRVSVADVIGWLDAQKPIWDRWNGFHAGALPEKPQRSKPGGTVLANSSQRLPQNARSFTRAVAQARGETATTEPAPPPRPPTTASPPPVSLAASWEYKPSGDRKRKGLAPTNVFGAIEPPDSPVPRGMFTSPQSSDAGGGPKNWFAPPAPPPPPAVPVPPETKTLFERLTEAIKQLTRKIEPAPIRKTVAEETATMTWAERKARLEKGGKLLSAAQAKARGLYQGEPTQREIVQQSEEAEQSERDRANPPRNWKQRLGDWAWRRTFERFGGSARRGGKIGKKIGYWVGHGLDKMAGVFRGGAAAAAGEAAGVGSAAAGTAGATTTGASGAAVAGTAAAGKAASAGVSTGALAGTAAAGTAAAATGMSLGSVLGAGAGLVTAFYANLTMVSLSCYTAAGVVRKFGEAASEAMRDLAKFSPVIAQSLAMLDYTRMQTDAQYARATGGSGAAMNDALADLIQEMEPMREMMGTITNVGLTALIKIADQTMWVVNLLTEWSLMRPLIRKLEELFGKNDKDKSPAIIKVLNEVMQGNVGGRPYHEWNRNRMPASPFPTMRPSVRSPSVAAPPPREFILPGSPRL